MPIAERAAAAALAGDHGHDRRGQPRHQRRLRAMASAWPRSSAPMPGIGARRVDERDDRLAELGRQLA
jgi:hypothetical protein